MYKCLLSADVWRIVWRHSWFVIRDEAIYAQNFIIYAMLQCFKLCPIMFLVNPYYAYQVSMLIRVFFQNRLHPQGRGQANL